MRASFRAIKAVVQSGETAAKVRLPAILLCVFFAVAALASAVPREAPEPQVNLLVVGDSGFGQPELLSDQQNTASAMAAYAGKAPFTFDAALVCGDNFKVRLTGPDDPQFRKGFEEMYDAKALNMPFYAVLGNHDYEYGAAAAELEHRTTRPASRWKMPAHWYRLEFPMAEPLVTVLMLDSNRESVGKEQWQAQLRWLEEELAKPRKSVWLLCLAHHPLFSDGQHGDASALHSAWGRLLKKYKVDFYLSGHDHVLQHLQLPDWPSTFIVSGGGGENTKHPITGKRGPFIRATHGFAVLRFGTRSARVSLIDATGAVLHAFERDLSGDIRIISTTPSDKP
jgi:tartrate-resistant acid phosphatase type 5